MNKFLLTLLLTPILVGCHIQDQTQISSSERTCRELKRNIIFNRTSTLSLTAASATEMNQMARMYDKYECSKLETSSGK